MAGDAGSSVQIGVLRRAAPVDQAAIDALMKASTAAIFPAFYDGRQTASSVAHIAHVDPLLIDDGTYFVIEVEGRIVACGGWSRRDKLFTGSSDQEGRAALLDPATQPARVRAMFVDEHWTRRGLGTQILTECERAAAAEGFRRLALMATLPGFALYRRFGFQEVERTTITLPDGVQLECVAMEKHLEHHGPTMRDGGRRGTVMASVLEAIGWTPAVDLARITAGIPGRIIAKLEYLNPGFSKKDRIARRIVEDATASGALAPGQPVVELTSGNTGTGLAIVCSVLGHPFVAVMSEGNSTERARMMRALGAEVVLVPQAAGSQRGQVSGEDLALVELRAQELTQERGAFRADQFRNPSASLAHEEDTATELWLQSDGQIDAFCDFVGTGGTFAGVTRALKARRAAIGCYVVEPEGAEPLAGKRVTRPNHRIQGGGYSMSELPLLDGVAIDGHLSVTDAAATAMTRRLAREEGIFGGFSAGAVVAAAVHLLETAHAGGTVAVLLADSGLKYLSTDLWRDLPPE